MSKSDRATQIRAAALAVSQEATRLLQQAFDLLLQGKQKEAKELEQKARAKHSESRKLMDEAIDLEKNL